MNYQYLRTMLKEDEGCSNRLYTCTAGKQTIGVGHNIEDLGLDDEVIDLQFAIDVDRAIAECKAVFRHWDLMPDSKQVVLANMMFNLGKPTFMGFKKMIAAVYLSDWATAADEMLDSRWAVQVKSRSARLAALMRG